MRLWQVPHGQEKTIKDLVNNVDGFESTIITYDNMSIDNIHVDLIAPPYIVDKLDMHKEKDWNEFLRLIGISNMNFQKKERNIKDEVIASQGGTIASRFSRFEPRDKAIKMINQKFETDIKVQFYDGLLTSLDNGGDLDDITNVDATDTSMEY
jgi:Phage Connector (GP10).